MRLRKAFCMKPILKGRAGWNEPFKCRARRAPSKETPAMLQGKMKSLAGQEVDLSQYKGKVVLIVNVASECGYTPQYKGLQALYNKYGPSGFMVLGFPCNQFGHQEPGTSEQIATFCQKNYGVTFDMFDKVDVNGRNQCE